MRSYNTNLAFSMQNIIDRERIELNDHCAILFINHGKEIRRDSHLLTSVHDGVIYEIVIEATSDKDADETVELFNSCLSVISGAPRYELNTLMSVIHYDKTSTSIPPPFTFSYCGDDLAYTASKMACIAGENKNTLAAVLKYQVSQEIFFLHPMDLEPHFQDKFDYQYLMSNQFKMGYSIIVAYSIIEELQLHVKASNEKPSSINGIWNPDVVVDIEERLSKKGIDPNKKIPWLSRNIMYRPFKKEISNVNLCKWSDGEVIRDFEISIKEAILETSYIRSQIAAHSNSEKITQLCLYDVENANMLVRSILIDTLTQNMQ